MDLGKELETLSWRRVLVLLRHLSPYGALAQALEHIPEESRDDREQVDEFFQNIKGVQHA